MHKSPSEEILRFWFEEVEHAAWFRKDAGFDRQLERRFGELLGQAMQGQLDDWCETPRGTLALIVLLDQFSRNIFRDRPQAFAADPRALQLALDGIDKGFDRALTLEQRSFFYLPLRHAEDLAMQKLGLEKTRELNAEGYGSDKYAMGHLQIIERFGRFPHRNAILGRRSTAEEEEYLKDPDAGY